MDSPRRPFRDSFEVILLAVLIALVVRTYLVTGYKVPGASMAPTLMPGDLIFAYRPAGGFKIPLSNAKVGTSVPERGQLVVLTFPDQPRVTYVKRVLGLPGDKIQMQQGRLTINDQVLEENPIDLPADSGAWANETSAVQEKWQDRTWTTLHHTPRGADFGPLVVPPNEVFVIGDHRDLADDSRYWGTVPIERIDGRVFLIWLSLNWEKRGAGPLPKPRVDRFLKLVH